jgi:uncharacterized protein
MISEEKIVHILRLMMDGLEKGGFATFSDRELAFREARKLCFTFITQWGSVAEAARQRILKQKNHPPEFSSQWETLFQKYYDEEVKKIGG